MSKRGAVVATAAAAVVAVAIPAWAYFVLGSSTTSPTVTAASLGTPVTGTPSATGSTVSFAVSAPSSGPAPTGYRVDRTAPTSVAGVCSLPAAGGTCTDSAAVPGANHTYAVYALRGAWESTTPASVSILVPDARSYTVTPATATPTAGTPFNVTLTAKSGTSTDTGYTGTKTLSWSGGQTIGAFAPVYPGTASFTNGVATVSVTLYKAGAQTLVATDANTTAYTGSAGVTVAAANAALSFSTCTNNAKTVARNTNVTTTVDRTTADTYGNSTGTPAVATVTLSPSTGNPKFTSSSVSFANGATSSGSATYNSVNAAATNTITASAPGYTNATCAITTT